MNTLEDAHLLSFTSLSPLPPHVFQVCLFSLSNYRSSGARCLKQQSLSSPPCFIRAASQTTNNKREWIWKIHKRRAHLFLPACCNVFSLCAELKQSDLQLMRVCSSDCHQLMQTFRLHLILITTPRADKRIWNWNIIAAAKTKNIDSKVKNTAEAFCFDRPDKYSRVSIIVDLKII